MDSIGTPEDMSGQNTPTKNNKNETENNGKNEGSDRDSESSSLLGNVRQPDSYTSFRDKQKKNVSYQN